MHYILFIPVLLTYAYNDSDIIITYAGHSEVELPASDHKETPPAAGTEASRSTVTDNRESDVVFVPNEKPVIRNEDFYRPVTLGEPKAIEATEPSKDVVFISGKNNENVEKPIREEKEIHADVIRVSKEEIKRDKNTRKERKLDCTNLDCDNTVDSVCGRREDEGKVKFRLFLNRCYLRKVNCAFKNDINRYAIVDKQKCTNIGSHITPKPIMYNPSLPAPSTREVRKEETRRTIVSRRSFNKEINGEACAHFCPVTCTEDYDPECAMSSAGLKKVFLNHCKLDYHSCLHETVWYRRPLSECVGRQKADTAQNRGFIGWMQRVGIVDKRGRIVASANQ